MLKRGFWYILYGLTDCSKETTLTVFPGKSSMSLILISENYLIWHHQFVWGICIILQHSLKNYKLPLSHKRACWQCFEDMKLCLENFFLACCQNSRKWPFYYFRKFVVQRMRLYSKRIAKWLGVTYGNHFSIEISMVSQIKITNSIRTKLLQLTNFIGWRPKFHIST